MWTVHLTFDILKQALIKSFSIFGNAIPLLRRAPVLRFLIPFVAGIILSGELPQMFLDYAVLLWIPNCIIWIILYRQYTCSFRNRHYFGITLHLFFTIAGTGWGSLCVESRSPDHYIYLLPAEGYKVRVVSSLQEKKKSFKALAEVESLKRKGRWIAASGKIMLYLKKDSSFRDVCYQDRLFFTQQPELVKQDTADRASALSRHRQIFGRAYIREALVVKPEKREFSLPAMAIRCRSFVSESLMKQFNYSREAAIAVALLVGEEVGIDEEISSAYAATGTLHVLAVSGMHVGLIYFLLGILFRPLSTHKTGRHFYYPLVMIFVWMYAFVAGAAPSIIRASSMCMFFLLSKWINRKNTGIGSLGASLFFLLMLNPFTIYEPGLQLSMCAVGGIIWLQRPLMRLWVPGNFVLFKIWEMSCISVAAQVMTLPVSLFYFGQFPDYFLLANLFVIPLTTTCIYGCILQLMLSPLPGIQYYVMMVNSWLLKISNEVVLEMKNWPGAVSHWNVSFMDMLLLYLFIFCLEAWLQTGRFLHVLQMLWIFFFASLMQLLLTM